MPVGRMYTTSQEAKESGKYSRMELLRKIDIDLIQRWNRFRRICYNKGNEAPVSQTQPSIVWVSWTNPSTAGVSKTGQKTSDRGSVYSSTVKTLCRMRNCWPLCCAPGTMPAVPQRLTWHGVF